MLRTCRTTLQKISGTTQVLSPSEVATRSSELNIVARLARRHDKHRIDSLPMADQPCKAEYAHKREHQAKRGLLEINGVLTTSLDTGSWPLDTATAAFGPREARKGSKNVGHAPVNKSLAASNAKTAEGLSRAETTTTVPSRPSFSWPCSL
jgi:hypothetical protein